MSSLVNAIILALMANLAFMGRINNKINAKLIYQRGAEYHSMYLWKG